MNKSRPVAEPVRINYLSFKNKYYILTDKTGYPSAEFVSHSGKGMLVPGRGDSSADPGGVF